MSSKEKGRGRRKVNVKGGEMAVITYGSLASSLLTASPEASLPPAIQTNDSDDSASVTNKIRFANKANERNKKLYSFLTETEEKNMVEWLEKNPIFFNKKLKAYKDKIKKEQLWREKAAEFDKDEAKLKIWYTSLRTRFGRLKKKKSRQEDLEMTERDEWVYNHFQFLTPYVHEIQPRRTASPTQTIATSTVSVGCLPKDDNIADVKMETEFIQSSQQNAGSSKPSEEQLCGSSHKSTSSLTSSHSSQILDTKEIIIAGMQEKTSKMFAIHEEYMRQQRGNDGERDAFVDWMRSVINELDQGLWRRCQREMTSILYRFQSENDDLKTKFWQAFLQTSQQASSGN